jgi:transcriptional regulator with XRE-family HTH domain
MAKRDMDEEETPHPRRRVLALGLHLTKRMEELDLSGTEVARQAGISPRQFNYYVNGERLPDLIMAKKIASILRITLDDLIDPRNFLNHRDERTHTALQRFYEVCTDLEPVDVGMVSEFAEFMAERRREEARAEVNFGVGIPPVCERLMRVHHILIPAILKRFAATRLETLVQTRDDEKLWVVIALEFDTHADRTAISNEMVAITMATRRLGLGEDEVRPLSIHSNLISVEVCLGPDPKQQKPAAAPKVRHRARSRPTLPSLRLR